MKRYGGTSLLEVLLFISIAGIIIVMAVRYAGSALRNLHEEQAIHRMQRLTDVSYQWLNQQRQANFNCQTPSQAIVPCEPITNNELFKAGLIDHEKIFDPWGGTITISAGDNPRYVKMSLTDVPQKECLGLKNKLAGVTQSTSFPACDKIEKNVFFGEF